MKKLVLLGSLSLLLLPALALAQSVDLLWQGEGYTPPFYQGGSPWTSEGRVSLLAIPQGLGNNATLNYRWTKDGTVLGSLSGQGKNVMGFNDSIFSKTQRITVEVVSGEGEVIAVSTVTITPVTPSLLIYEKNPLYGFMFHNEASRGYRFSSEEITLAAFPLFFSTAGRDYGSLKYAWKSNAGDDGKASLITYRIPSEATGSASISLALSNTNTLRQLAEKKFLIQFGNND